MLGEPQTSTGYKLPGLGGWSRSPGGRPLISLPLPRSASAQGRLVAGFPAGAVRLAPGSRVVSSNVAGEARTLQVSLVAHIHRSPARVLQFYRTQLLGKGFTELAAPSVGGTRAATFARGKDNLVVAVRPAGRGSTTYTLFASLHAGHAR